MPRMKATKLAWILALAHLCSAPFAFCQGKKDPAPPPKLKVGDTAPAFKLQYFDGNNLKDVTLDQYRGKQNVVLAFYVFAFTGG